LTLTKTLKTLLVSSVVATSLFAGSTVATVNGENITKEEIKGLFNANFDALSKAQKKQAIDILVEREVIYGDAKKQNYEKEKLFKEAMKEVKKELLVNYWKKKVANDVKVTEKEAKDFYNKNKNKFKRKESVQARHILLKTDSEAKAVIKELNSSKNKLATFKKLAKTKSIGPSAKVEGSLGWFTKDKMVPAFAKAAFALKKSNYTKTPVKTQFGYHVIYLEDKKGSSVAKFDEIKKMLRQQMAVKKLQVELKKKIEKLKSKAKIVIK
jgi:parvulin-like peptidyl-prolyl isomerase